MTGGAGGAAGNGGVPVLQGLGGGSATGVLFPSLICLGARRVESSRSEPPETCSWSGSDFLVLGPVFEGLIFQKKHLMSHARATDFSRKTAYSINFATSVRHAQHCACRTHGEILKVYANTVGSLLDLLAGGGRRVGGGLLG